MPAARGDRSEEQLLHRPPLAHEPPPVAHDAERPPHEPVLRLQRAAGNRATTAALGEPLRVGSAADPAERAADEMADRVLRRLLPTPEHVEPDPDVHRSSSGGALAGAFDADADVAARIRDRSGRGAALPSQVRRSMEQGFGTSLGDVRIHTDGEAARLSDSLGAEAFTHGRDVFFGAGRFDPTSSGGTHLIAHELAHVVQGGAGAQRTAVRRKLKGTRAAITDMGGKATLGSRLKGSDYPKILSKLDDYEARESKVVAKKAFGKGDREWMTKTLDSVLVLIDGWTSRHDDERARKRHGRALSDMSIDAYSTAKGEKDYEKMAAVEERAQGDEDRKRVSALTMLRPRVALERKELLSPAYFTSAARADGNRATSAWNKDNAVGGAMNRLDQVAYSDGKSGYFIRDKASAMEGADVATYMGIDKIDPNQGARSVASSRLAKLFGAKEVANIEFATHESATRYKERSDAKATRRLGVFSEKAEGSEAADYKVARNDVERQEYGDSKVLDANDPELQRGLNVLQMIDYISRQMDRHMHNVYIATDSEGRVVGVTGIDLDLSFGARNNDGGKLDPMQHFVGIPQLADAAFRAKVLSVTPAEVRDCLEGLLSEAEVAGTLERLTHLQGVLRDMDPSKIVPVGGWGASTAAQQRDEDTSYLAKMTRGTLFEQYDAAAQEICRPLTQAGLNTERRKLMDAVEPLVVSGRLSAGQGRGLLEALVLEIGTDQTLADKRRMQTGTRNDASAADKAVALLTKAKASVVEQGGADQETMLTRAEAQLMAAQVEKAAAAVIRDAADKEYNAALDAVITTLSDFAVRVASRQKRAMGSGRRPARV